MCLFFLALATRHLAGSASEPNAVIDSAGPKSVLETGRLPSTVRVLIALGYKITKIHCFTTIGADNILKMIQAFA